jgi:hypothetical protein
MNTTMNTNNYFESEFITNIINLLKGIDDIKNNLNDKTKINAEVIKLIISVNKLNIETLLKLNYTKWNKYVSKVYEKCLEFERDIENKKLEQLYPELCDEFKKSNDEVKEIVKLMMDL